MSLAEVLTAARALPRDERVELVRTLAEQNAAELEQFPQFFRDWIASGEPLELNLPIQAPEAAAVLQQLLAQQERPAS